MGLNANLITCYQQLWRSFGGLIRKFRRPGGRILIYHDIAPQLSGAFSAQLEWLLEQGFDFVTATDYVRRVAAGERKLCAVTFDDGFAGVMENALPVMRKLGIPGTLFINQQLHVLTERNDLPGLEAFCRELFPRLSLQPDFSPRGMDLSMLREWIDSGNELGGHTVKHRRVSATPPEELRAEFLEQRNYFRRYLNYDLQVFAYPYGRARDISPRAAECCRDCGYAYAFTGVSASPYRKCEALFYPRTSISLQWPPGYFRNVFYGSEDLKDRLLGEYRRLNFSNRMDRSS